METIEIKENNFSKLDLEIKNAEKWNYMSFNEFTKKVLN